MSTVSTAPFEFFDVTVRRAVDLGASMRRVTFRGPGLGALRTGGRDQRVKLFLPHPHQERAVVPRSADWWPRWRSMPPAERAVMRTYTACGQRRDPDEVDIDFALHGTGPAATWAAAARPGADAVLLGPTEADNAGVDFRPPADTGWVLLAGDTTALPAVAGILAWLPGGLPAYVFLDVPRAADVRALPTAADAAVTWLPGGAAGGLVEAVRAARLPAGVPYAWIAGESAVVRALRRHLVADRCVDRSRITFTGYWRRGACEEDLLREAVAAGA